MKICYICHISQPLDEFYRNSGTRDGRQVECKSCTKARERARYLEHADEIREKARQWRADHPERVREVARRYRDKNREKIAAHKRSRNLANRLAKYGMTPELYGAVLLRQGDGCAVCGGTDRLQIDHDHKCCPGERACGNCVRGILCQWCNHSIGHAGDDPVRLRKLADYLDRGGIL